LKKFLSHFSLTRETNSTLKTKVVQLNKDVKRDNNWFRYDTGFNSEQLQSLRRWLSRTSCTLSNESSERDGQTRMPLKRPMWGKAKDKRQSCKCPEKMSTRQENSQPWKESKNL